MLKDGENLYRDARGRKGSIKALAEAIHRSEDAVQQLVRAARFEDELYKHGGRDREGLGVGPTENASVYRYTAPLRANPELRKELIAFVTTNETGLHDNKSLRQVAQALSYAPDSKDQIFAKFLYTLR